MSADCNLGAFCSSNDYLKKSLSRFQKNLNLGHINAQSINPSAKSVKLNELKSIVKDKYLDIIEVSETWLKSYISTSSVHIEGYNFCRNDRSMARGGGVGLYISKHLKYKIVFESSNEGVCEALFIEVTHQKERILVGVVYLPYGDIRSLESTLSNIVLRYDKTIIMGDFNNNMFDSRKSLSMYHICHELNLSCFHNIKPTYFDTSLFDLFL